jgi:RND superfamily putative drug exporter
MHLPIPSSSLRIGELFIVSLASISRFVLRHKLLVVLFWVALTVAGVVSTGPVGDAISTRFDLPGRESTEVNTEIARGYGAGGFGNPYTVVVRLPEGASADDPAVKDELAAVLDKVELDAPETRSVSYASTGDPAFVSDDGRTTFALIYPIASLDGPSPSEAKVDEALHGATVAGEPIHVAGLAGAEEASSDEQGTGVLVETLIGAGGAMQPVVSCRPGAARPAWRRKCPRRSGWAVIGDQPAVAASEASW